MLTAPLKIGLAAACLVGVAAIIAWDLVRSHAPEVVIATPSPAATMLVPALPAPEPVVRPPAGDAVLCPPAPKEEPKALATPEPPAKPAAPSEPPQVYTVSQGDTLYGISVKLYGTPRHYERIYEANKDRIRDPNTLQVGVNLRMPDLAGK
ncbi:MAG: LysM peptidoglycan-binding domain-containing protein [Planctomycetes bacterium]|nr:LysM peptidoglycan-binding domain-containing protein [Planctomycetota bacterium]